MTRPSRNTGAAQRAAAAMLAAPQRGNASLAREAGCTAQTVWLTRRQLEAAGCIPSRACGPPKPPPLRPSRTRDAIQVLGISATPRDIAALARVSVQMAWKALQAARTAPSLTDAACAADRLVIVRQQARLCAQCGQPFTPVRLPSAGGTRQVYCTRDCARLAHIERQRSARPGKTDAAARTPRIRPLPPAPDWARGLCTTVPSWQRAWWTSEDRDERQAAARMCRDCPVLAECQSWSLSLPLHDDAIYAGLAARDRRELRRRHLAEIAAQVLG
jgi:hypothetical protein